MALANSKKKVFDGRYEILSIVGRGSRSVVYHARLFSDPSSEVALKVLMDQQDRAANSERLRKEALAMVSCRHRYVIRLDDFHSFQDLCYLSMEFAPEADLRKYTAKIGGILGIAQAERFLLQAARALSFIHQTGALHRDIKPDNILVLNDREIRIGDFGVAVLAGEKPSISELERGVGTMSYMAPEVLEGKNYTAQSDLYALGVTIYELLTGSHPFEHLPLASQLEGRQNFRVNTSAGKHEKLPPHIVDAIEGLVSFDPASRFKSADELIETIINKDNEEAGAPSGRRAARGSDEPRAQAKSQKSETALASKHPIKEELSKTTPVSEASNGFTTKSGDNTTETPESGFKPKQSIAEKSETTRNDKSTATKKEAPLRHHATENPVTSDVDKTLILTQEVIDKMSGEKKKKKGGKAEASQGPSLGQRLFAHRNRKKLLGLVAIVVVFFIFARFDFNSSRTSPSGVTKNGATPDSVAEGDSSSSLLPVFAGGALNFPYLPPGVYNGSISDLIPGQSAPLVMISFEDRLVIVVGIEGWTPEVIRREDLVESGISPGESHLPLRVRSNGFVLNLTGREIEGELIGFFRNVATNETGEWDLKPQF